MAWAEVGFQGRPDASLGGRPPSLNTMTMAMAMRARLVQAEAIRSRGYQRSTPVGMLCR